MVSVSSKCIDIVIHACMQIVIHACTCQTQIIRVDFFSMKERNLTFTLSFINDPLTTISTQKTSRLKIKSFASEFSENVLDMSSMYYIDSDISYGVEYFNSSYDIVFW